VLVYREDDGHPGAEEGYFLEEIGCLLREWAYYIVSHEDGAYWHLGAYQAEIFQISAPTRIEEGHIELDI